jgi:hypothetical protein
MSQQPLGSDGDATVKGERNLSEYLVFYSPPLEEIYGIPIFIQNLNSQNSMISRKSTAGGIISIHGKFFALTVAYIFCNTLVEEQVLYDGDLNYLSKTKRGRIAGILRAKVISSTLRRTRQKASGP